MIRPVRGRTTFRAFHRAPVARSGAIKARCLRAPGGSTSADDSRAADLGVAVAYALGRRVGSAVERNRIRRRLRAAVGDLDRRGDVLVAGASYLLAAGPEAGGCPFPDLLMWVGEAVREAGARSVPAPAKAQRSRPSISAGPTVQ